MKTLLFLLLTIVLCFDLPAQDDKEYPDDLSEQFHGLAFRNIGPYRGGRSNTVSGVINDPFTYYMGTVGGGIYKTTDAGITWKNISDGQLATSSVGALAVSESDPNVIYAGMGEHAIRGVMTSHGDGIYKSEDAGATWTHIGLPKSQHISRIRIHPDNPDVAYVAVQGAIYAPTSDRGIYKTTDGGESWEKVLFIDDNTGAADISMDMTNPRILYASMWDYQRHPWMVRSGGPGSGIHKSTDGGETWTKLTKGLPKEMGKVAVDVSRANPSVVYANIEAENGGVYKSTDGGKSWTQTCKDRITITRSWYYIEIYADPQDENVVYVMNAPFLKSIDGGKTFSTIRVPHGDQHDLWIHPTNNKVMINANDGGANITMNGGKSWSAQDNQATAQFYRVITDNQFPYRVYAGQQDNSTVSIMSRTNSGTIGQKDWTRSAGGESAFLAFDEDNPTKVYGGSYQGNISEYDVATQTTKDIMAYPVLGLGTLAKNMKYRFNWNAPIVVAPQNPDIMYHGGNHVLKTTDGGRSWMEISPDLTRNDKSKQGPGGGPITNEGAGGENYNTITYMVASPHEQGVLYVGTDDGLVHVTKNDGGTWDDITPSGLTECLINSIEVSPHDPAKVYMVATKYKMNIKTPMVYISDNYGKSWKMQTNGIPDDNYVRVVREDKKVPGLLYGGTENGLYISHNDGKEWHPMQLNLPVSPVNDLTIRDNDLVVATSGRAFWILDDLSSIQQMAKSSDDDKLVIFTPKDSYKYGLNSPTRAIPGVGQNPLPGVILDYHLPEDADSISLQLDIMDADGNLVRSYKNKKDKENPGAHVLPSKKGVNRTYWDMSTKSLPKVKGLNLLQGLGGHKVPPGTYQAKLMSESDTVMTSFIIKAYPGIKATQADFDAQYDFLNEVAGVFKDVHHSVSRMGEVKAQLKMQKDLLKDKDGVEEVVTLNDSLQQEITNWTEELVQPKHKTFQDIINFENQLNAELLDLIGRADDLDPTVTAGAKERLQDLKAEWAKHQATMMHITDTLLPAYEKAYKLAQLPTVIVPSADEE